MNGGARGGPGGPSGAPLQLDPLVGYKVQRFWPQARCASDGLGRIPGLPHSLCAIGSVFVNSDAVRNKCCCTLLQYECHLNQSVLDGRMAAGLMASSATTTSSPMSTGTPC